MQALLVVTFIPLYSEDIFFDRKPLQIQDFMFGSTYVTTLLIKPPKK